MERVGLDLTRAPALVAERGCVLGRPMHLLASTTSTNDEAKRGAHEGAVHGETWLAEEQTAGRGRQGRMWRAARGESLLFSVLLRLSCLPARLPLVSLVAGLAVRDAVAKAAPSAAVGIKWPNDVVAGEAGPPKKASGILVEAITTGKRVQAVVVGVGINVHTREFPDDIAGSATSVALLSGGKSPPPDRAEILADVLAGLDRDLHVVLARGLGVVRARLDAADTLRGRSVQNAMEADGASGASGASGAKTTNAGVAAGIDDEGRLLVRLTEGDTVRWSAGEVHLTGFAP